jgi:hypothetical protein
MPTLAWACRLVTAVEQSFWPSVCPWSTRNDAPLATHRHSMPPLGALHKKHAHASVGMAPGLSPGGALVNSQGARAPGSKPG